MSSAAPPVATPVAAARARITAALDLFERTPVQARPDVAAHATDLLRSAQQHGLTDLVQRTRLVLAGVSARAGDTAEAGRVAREVDTWAREHQDQPLMARSALQLSDFYAAVGDLPSAAEQAIRSVELLAPDVHPLVRANHLLSLAIWHARMRSFTAARERFIEVLAIADEGGHLDLRLVTLNDLAYLEHQAGQPAAAMTAALQLVDLCERHGRTLEPDFADTVARAHLDLGRYAEAEAVLAPTLASVDDAVMAEVDSLPEILLTAAECQRLAGAHDRAQRTLDRVRDLCHERDLRAVRVSAMQEQAALLAARGEYQAAYELHRTFQQASTDLYSAERDARARLLSVVFETEQAVRTSRRFRELSLRDALTGLYNRRYIEERLPALLHRCPVDGSCLSLAIIDVDHFKRVNDELSHEAGDGVLRTLAELLAALVPDEGFVARLGGEEFLLVLPGAAPDVALAWCQRVVDAVRGHDWRPVAGRLPLTVSIGVASTGPQVPQLGELLAVADARLYAAKHAGRDRVVGDPAVAGSPVGTASGC